MFALAYMGRKRILPTLSLHAQELLLLAKVESVLTTNPHTPGFPVNVVGIAELHAAFLNESRTRGRWLGPRTENPGISLVFREIWDSTALPSQL